ncbi:MAG: ATP-binding protein, partial [Desulfobacteraceae bacterium]|nr:ATP-binding protein [Desulfobacteraceae bacterium]
GYLGDPKRTCKCSPFQVRKYRGRISGPLVDRIDIHVEVPAVAYRKLRSTRPGTSSADIRQQVISARQRQKHRFGPDSTLTNARMTSRAIRKHCPLDDSCESLLKQAMHELGLSARAHDKLLKLSRTIADLADSDAIKPEHLSEAIQYRLLDRTL